MPRIVLDFNMSNQREATVYNYLSDFANGKKAIVVQSILHTIRMNEEGATVSTVYMAPERSAEKTVKKEKKERPPVTKQEPQSEVMAEPVKEEPVIITPTAPTPAANPLPSLGSGLGGLGGAPGFKLNITKDKDPRLTFLSDSDYDTVVAKFEIDDNMTPEFLAEFRRIYEDNEGYPGNVAMKMNRAVAETYVSLTMKN